MKQNREYTFRHFWLDYQSEVIFGLVLSAMLIASAWLSQYIPEQLFESIINPMLSCCRAAICFFGAALCFKHHNGIHVRRSWAYMLIAWGAWEILMIIVSKTLDPAIMEVGTDTMAGTAMVVACFFAWLLFIYPTEVLRPGWLNWTHMFLQLLPLLLLWLLDYYVPADLRWLIALYPIGLFIILIDHIRKYREWCEDNFSTLDDIDVQWIVRYVMMVIMSGLVFWWLCISHQPARAFTQQWFLMFLLAYTTEHVLYRPDPWKQLRSTAEEEQENEDPVRAAYRATLDAWIEQEKPYLNPDFQLIDLRRVLPLNRTYLSRLINSEFGCSFYQWVNGLRIEEAKRLMTEQPDLKLQEVAERCGFSSPVVFSRIFTRETGIAPSKWEKGKENR